jgi:hypothetical protein
MKEIESLIEYFRKLDIEVIYDEKEKVLKSKKS